MYSIAIVVPELLPVPPTLGGAVEHWVDEVSKRMVSDSRKIAVVSRPAGVRGHEAIEYIAIPWTATEKFFYKIKQRVTWKNPLRYLAKIQNVYSYSRRVALAVQKFDLIYLHNEPNILFFLHKQPTQQIILHMHNDHLSIPWLRFFYRRALSRVDKIICVSDYIRKQAVSHFPEYAERFDVLLNATDANVFKPYADEGFLQLKNILSFESDKQYLLYVGRLTPIKGVHVLIEAFFKIYSQKPNTRLIIVGSSFFKGSIKTPYEKKLEALAKPIQEAIIFTGYLAHEKLKYLYSAVDIVVFPSVSAEGFGLVIIEAMSSGTCLIASAIGGTPEIFENGKSGMLVKPGDVEELAETISTVLKSPNVMESMGKAARQKVLSDYTWEHLVDKLETLLKT